MGNKMGERYNEEHCFYCDKLAEDTRNIVVDVDVSHDGDGWFNNPLHEDVGLCKEHLETYENGELEDNERD
jgi:hypothetical protein